MHPLILHIPIPYDFLFMLWHSVKTYLSNCFYTLIDLLHGGNHNRIIEGKNIRKCEVKIRFSYRYAKRKLTIMLGRKSQ